jgi:hypothetical protein
MAGTPSPYLNDRFRPIAPRMAEPVAIKYRAFISYSHATNWAKWLHRELEGFRIDKDLVGHETSVGTAPSTLRLIFRDRDDFTAGHTLTEQTLAALDASAALVVICSPASAKSHYVDEEIRLFKSRHPERPVIPLIVAGKPGDAELECFPPALKFKVDAKGRVGKKPVELLAADAREEGDSKNLALAKVVAGLLGVSSDEVWWAWRSDVFIAQGNLPAALESYQAVLAASEGLANKYSEDAVLQLDVASSKRESAMLG